MKSISSSIVDLASSVGEEQTVITAKVARVDNDGRVYVYLDRSDKETSVKVISGIITLDNIKAGDSALLLRDSSESGYLILLGIVVDFLISDSRDNRTSGSKRISARHIKIEAGEEVRIDCGRSSIVLTKDGRIVMRGVRITSRASSSNRIKGGSVQIN